MFERSVHSNHTNGFDTERFDGLGGFLRFAPPPSQNGITPDVLVARWVAGAGEAGLVDITGGVEGLASHDMGAGANLVIFVDGVSVFDVIVTGEGQVSNFDLSAVAINSGSTVDFVVDDLGANTFDFIGLTATVQTSSIPEPGPLAVAAIAFCGLCLYRRKRAA